MDKTLKYWMDAAKLEASLLGHKSCKPYHLLMAFYSLGSRPVFPALIHNGVNCQSLLGQIGNYQKLAGKIDVDDVWNSSDLLRLALRAEEMAEWDGTNITMVHLFNAMWGDRPTQRILESFAEKEDFDYYLSGKTFKNQVTIEVVC